MAQQFDLNYVGFKSLYYIRILPYSFMFDLNYVGFKCLAWGKGDKSKYSLIWTMWDLNSTVLQEIDAPEPRLIWTMWDLNILFAIFLCHFSFVWSELCGI